jgi:hypothetical protein
LVPQGHYIFVGFCLFIIRSRVEFEAIANKEGFELLSENFNIIENNVIVVAVLLDLERLFVVAVVIIPGAGYGFAALGGLLLVGFLNCFPGFAISGIKWVCLLF